MSWGEFKSTASEVGSWLWGTVQGSFNERQTIGQVVTDATISMFPIAGEVTAARDVIASSLRLAEYPEKREETVEWVMLVLPLLAIVPLFGGALKGIGKLLLRAGQNAAEDKKILEACIALLNKVGHGNAEKFIKELDFTRYGNSLLGGVNEVGTRLIQVIDFLPSKMGNLLPERVLKRFASLKEGISNVQRLAGRMVPKALKDLNNRLRYIQRLVYEGEWHAISGAGKHITRETEARLVSKSGKMEWTLTEAKFPQNSLGQFVEKTGWPDLATYLTPTKVPYAINSFSGEMRAVELTEGTIIYRIVDRVYGKNVSTSWMYVDPKTIRGYYWRVKLAVMQRWNHNGLYIKYVIPKGKTLRAWEGKAAAQIDNDVMRQTRDVETVDGEGFGDFGKELDVSNEGFGQYLEGGETQLFIDFKFDHNSWATKEVNMLPRIPTEWEWTDHMNINLVPKTADVQKLGTWVEEQKTLAAANLATAANQSGRAVRAANQN